MAKKEENKLTQYGKVLYHYKKMIKEIDKLEDKEKLTHLSELLCKAGRACNIVANLKNITNAST